MFKGNKSCLKPRFAMLVMIKKIIIKDVMRNTNVKEEIVKWKSIFFDFIVIKRNIT